jgi:16S rRNA (cytosine1402-N4)-methyltransferase
MPKQKQTHNVHTPVLLNEVIEYLKPQAGESYLDLTAGYGGHAQAVLDITKAPEAAVLVDRDRQAIDHLQEKFGDSNARIMQSDFANASKQLQEANQQFDIVLADLGTSSVHFDMPERGFSFSSPGPLDMRMDNSQELTAEIILNTWKERDIAQMLRDYGEEPKAHKIARQIVASRPLDNTEQLAQIAKKAYPGHSRSHPATRTFQALRIAVNDELGQLSSTLPRIEALLKPGGRMAVISFHSLEDAIVKNFLAELAGDRYDAQLELLNKKPITASPNEIDFNPRARSAKLRAAAKNKNK